MGEAWRGLAGSCTKGNILVVLPASKDHGPASAGTANLAPASKDPVTWHQDSLPGPKETKALVGSLLNVLGRGKVWGNRQQKGLENIFRC